MPTTIRYKDVRNTSGAVFTATNYPYNTDGDDKKQMLVKRTLAAIDIGTGAGQTQHASGLIVDSIPATSNILSVQLYITRAVAVIGTQTPYYNIQGEGNAYPITSQFYIKWYIDTDNCLRIVDGGAAAEVRLIESDIIQALIIIGNSESTADTLNP
jgi:hypothetical protein